MVTRAEKEIIGKKVYLTTQHLGYGQAIIQSVQTLFGDTYLVIQEGTTKTYVKASTVHTIVCKL